MARRAASLCLALAAIGSLALPAVAPANLAGEVQEGRRLTQSLESGQADCAGLGESQFDAIGEYAMARYVGSERAHEAMNRRMVGIMGEAGESRMHAALGRHYGGCGGAVGTRWIASMAGMMDGGRGGFGPGMMAGRGHWGAGSSGVSTAGWIAILIGVAALAVAATLWLSRWRPRGD
jgi:hypothetical protein